MAAVLVLLVLTILPPLSECSDMIGLKQERQKDKGHVGRVTSRMRTADEVISPKIRYKRELFPELDLPKNPFQKNPFPEDEAIEYDLYEGGEQAESPSLSVEMRRHWKTVTRRLLMLSIPAILLLMLLACCCHTVWRWCCLWTEDLCTPWRLVVNFCCKDPAFKKTQELAAKYEVTLDYKTYRLIRNNIELIDVENQTTNTQTDTQTDNISRLEPSSVGQSNEISLLE